MEQRWQVEIERVTPSKRGAKRIEQWLNDGWEIIGITEVPEVPRRLTVVFRQRVE